MPAKTTQPAAPAQDRRPVQTFRLGWIKAAVWENEADGRTYYAVTFARTYRDEGRFHDTDSFGRDDLPLVAKLADQAHTFIFAQLRRSAAEPGE
jgi:hypothetical protein